MQPSTHRVLQLSQLSDSLSAIATECERAARNAAHIRNHTAATRFANRARRAHWINQEVTARLQPVAQDFESFASACKSRIELDTPRRPGNALNIEIGTPAPRCMNKRPDHWGESMTAIRWLASGGDALVLGVCSRSCPIATTSLQAQAASDTVPGHQTRSTA
jgi:hypothetical protein